MVSEQFNGGNISLLKVDFLSFRFQVKLLNIDYVAEKVILCAQRSELNVSLSSFLKKTSSLLVDI